MMSMWTLEKLKKRFDAKGMTLEEAAYIAGELLQENAAAREEIDQWKRAFTLRQDEVAVLRKALEEAQSEIKAWCNAGYAQGYQDGFKGKGGP